METIAQQLGITEFPFEIRNTNGKEIYFENSKGNWRKRKYDSNGNQVCYESSDGIKREYDTDGNQVYYENSAEFWSKRKYDSNGNQVYYENSDGDWWKREYDSNGKEIYYETSDGYWEKREYDTNGNEIYYVDSDGLIIDKRPKIVELTLDQIAEKMGIDVSQLRIKD